jgi:hypothetical protein
MKDNRTQGTTEEMPDETMRDETMRDEPSRMRADKFLWIERFFRSPSMALPAGTRIEHGIFVATVLQDSDGLPKVVEIMSGFAANPNADPSFWTPAPLLAKLAAAGKRFNG